MNRDLLPLLACPACGRSLRLTDEEDAEGEVRSGRLACTGCAAAFPIVAFVPRFVGADNYAGSFGFQWNRFRRTQLDSSTGQPISRRRFFDQSRWDPAVMANGLTLDVGCGAGRFAEVALGTGTRLVAVDYSTAVDACRANLAPNPRLDVVQADVYHLPFREARFDFVYSFGVLQHTPDVAASFRALARQLAPGGRLAVDVYPRLALNVLWPKYWLRPLTKRMRAEALFGLVTRAVPALWPVSLALGRVPLIGRRLRYALPILNYEGVLPLTPAQLEDWAVLDTFDMLAPAHDHPQSVESLRQWFEAAGLADVDVARRGLIVGTGRRPAPVG